MSSNLEWQRQQVNERVQGALREGVALRKVRGRRSGGRGPVVVKAALILAAAWFFLGVVLAGCTPVETALAGEPGAAPVITMADRIAFQDRVWEASHPPEKAETDLTKLSPADVSAYRWIAMGEYFVEEPSGISVDLRTLSADDVMAYRWISMARFYAGYFPVEDQSD